MPKLIANRKINYAGRDIQPDEEFEASDGDAHILTRCLRPLARAPGEAKPERPAAPRQKRRYQRRDMRARE